MVLQNSNEIKHVSFPKHINGRGFVRVTDYVLCCVGTEAMCVYLREYQS
jgi:hypothetical protein